MSDAAVTTERLAGRDEIDQLTEAGHLTARARDAALNIAGVTPNRHDWNQFLSRLFLLLGVTFLIAAAGFFVAYNWDDLGRFAKIGLLEIIVAAGAIAAIVWTPGDLRSRAALLAAVLATGPLLAYIGQTYQTGADNYELFRAWALATLPWVLVARWRPLWCAWMLIVDVSVTLYFGDAWRPLANLAPHTSGTLTVLLMNAAGLVLLEQFAKFIDGAGRSAERFAIASIIATALFIYLSFLLERSTSAQWQVWVPLLAMAALWGWYRLRHVDMVALSLWCFAAITAVLCTMGHLMINNHTESFSFLAIGVAAISLSAWAAFWLRQVKRTTQPKAEAA